MASLTGRLDAYHRSLAGLQAAKQAVRAQMLPVPRFGPEPLTAANAAGTRTLPHLPGPAHIRRELARVTATLRAYQHASQGAQNAIETALRGMGRVTVNSALLLLPPKVAIPVGIAVRAIANVVDRGVDLGLGR